MSLSGQVASKADEIVYTLVQTDYQHNEKIDPTAGVYDCDCNGFVGFVLEAVASVQYALVPKEMDQPRPRAFEYYLFFASLTQGSSGSWHRVEFLRDARPGDILVWRFPTIEADENTGHVMIVDAAPTSDAAGVFSVRVCDSAAEAHFDDTRGSGPGQFLDGVGKGSIQVKVDGDGRPIAFLFAPPATAEFTYLPIAIGRLEQVG
jgi:hypothetical protein